MSDINKCSLIALLGVEVLGGAVVGWLGDSRAGLEGLRALLGSCAWLWGARWELEQCAMGGESWGRGLTGVALRLAARQRFFWAQRPSLHCSVALSDSWHGAYAFAAGASGCAVIGRTANLVSVSQRNVCVWYMDARGTMGRAIQACHRGHDLLLGHSDAEPGRMGQWLVVSFELVDLTQGVLMFNGQMEPIYEMHGPRGSAPLRLSSSVAGGCGHYCVFSPSAFYLLSVGDGEVTPARLRWGRRVCVLGVAFLGGTLYVVEERTVSAVSLGTLECARMWRGGPFTGAVCALEAGPGRPGLALMTREGCVGWWEEGGRGLRTLYRVHDPPPLIHEDFSLHALGCKRVAIVERGGRVRVVCHATGALEDDFRVAWKPPQQIKVLAGEQGRSCVAVLRAECTLTAWGAAELCRVGAAI